MQARREQAASVEQIYEQLANARSGLSGQLQCPRVIGREKASNLQH
jgi:hypothetical protein